MRYFYDTEFGEDGTTIDLVSIGIVAEDGREFYAVSSEFDTGKLLRNPWLIENVWPSLPKRPKPENYTCRCPHGHLDTDHPDVRPRAQIANAVRDFLTGTNEHVELWAYYGAYDHVALAQLWGPMMALPKGIPMWTHDLNQLAEQVGVDGEEIVLPKQESGLHNALADARWTRDAWRYLTTDRS